MLKAAYTVLHPDRNIAFFNDSAFSVATPYDELMKYASNLGINTNINKSQNNFKSGGFYKFLINTNVLITDLGEIGAKYQPGHAHADSLSFEFSLNGNRLFVNSGTSTYEISKLRHFQRSSQAHNVLTVNNENSSDVWSSFRVGKRARILYSAIKSNKKDFYITAKHDGYKCQKGHPIHERSWEFKEYSLTIKDKVHLNKLEDRKIIIRYFLHPDCFARIKGAYEGIIESGEKVIKWKTNHQRCWVENTKWYPEFNKEVDNQCICFEINDSLDGKVEFKW